MSYVFCIRYSGLCRMPQAVCLTHLGSGRRSQAAGRMYYVVGLRPSVFGTRSWVVCLMSYVVCVGPYVLGRMP